MQNYYFLPTFNFLINRNMKGFSEKSMAYSYQTFDGLKLLRNDNFTRFVTER